MSRLRMGVDVGAITASTIVAAIGDSELRCPTLAESRN